MSYPYIALNVTDLVYKTSKLIELGYTYGYGQKLVDGYNPNKQVDCSGLVRYLIGDQFPDGSVQQHDYIKAKGFLEVPLVIGHRYDGNLYIGFLPPDATSDKIGHVFLLNDNLTLESHGGKGPDRRIWGRMGFESRCSLYLLNPTVEGFRNLQRVIFSPLNW